MVGRGERAAGKDGHENLGALRLAQDDGFGGAPQDERQASRSRLRQRARGNKRQ